MSQKDKILKHLENHGTITPMEALKEVGCFRLAARIHELREEGHAINVIEDDNDYATYTLIQPGQQDAFGQPKPKNKNGVIL